MPKWPDITARYGQIPLLRLPRGTERESAASSGRPAAGRRPSSSLGTLRIIGGYLLRSKARLSLVAAMIVISSVLGVAGPFMLGDLVQTYLVGKKTEGFAEALILLAALYIVQTGAILLQSYAMIGVAQRTVADIRRDLFAKLHRTAMSAYSGKKTGDLMSRLTNDIDNVSQTLSGTCLQVSSSLLTFAGMLGLMLWLDVRLTLISLALIPFMFWSMRWITRRTGKLFRAQQKELGGMAGFVDETIAGQLIVKSYAQERRMLESFGVLNRKVSISSYWAQTYSGFIPKVFFVLNNLSFSIIAAAGSVLALGNLVTIGAIVTFMEYARQFTRPLNDLASQINTMFAAIAGAERAFELMGEEEEEGAGAAGKAKADRLRGEIEFEDVGFGYEPGQHILRDIRFAVRPGQTLALVGATGAGKTTIAQLLGGFYRATVGKVRIDGIDIGDYDLRSLRRRMAFVLQDSILFEMSVSDNLRYGKPDASREEIEEAARRAGAHGFISALPCGYDTIVGAENNLSQGQRQLLAIARAILANPVILVLDEATSSIDTVTESSVQQALLGLMQGRTNVIIAHRLSTVQTADLILVLDGGRTVEQGTHEQLAKRNGYYRRLLDASGSAAVEP